ncbi:hypothetical protein LTR85_006067 [Meristemomyces frigidus]|nr:hypothetical protein LTR85_006067 [Meristemomyces frigidus]
MNAQDNSKERVHPNWTDFWFIRQYPKGLAEPSLVYDCVVRKVSPTTRTAMEAETRSMLSAACKDLLCCPSHTNASVQFLHRTVHDFLQAEDMQKQLDENVPAHFKSSRIFHLFNLLRLKLILPTTTESDESKGLRDAVGMFVDMPVTLFNEAYVAAFEKTLCLRQAFEPEAQRHWPSLLIIFLAFGRDEYVLKDLDDASSHAQFVTYRYHVPNLSQSARRECVQMAAFGEHSLRKFGLESVDPKLISKLLTAGVLACDRVDDGGCSNNIWQLFLRKWAVTSRYRKTHSVMRPVKLAEALHNWELAKLLLAWGAPLGEEFCSDPSAAGDTGHQHERCVAGDFLRSLLPAAWLLESTLTGARKLSEGFDSKANKELPLSKEADRSPSEPCEEKDGNDEDTPEAIVKRLDRKWQLVFDEQKVEAAVCVESVRWQVGQQLGRCWIMVNKMPWWELLELCGKRGDGNGTQ